MHTTTRTTITLDALAVLFPHQVATSAELLTLGLPHEELISRCRRGGEWQHLLPGVLLLRRKPPNRLQWVQAALRYAGSGALLTGVDALQLHGLRTLPADGPVTVLSTRPVEPVPEVRAIRPRGMPAPVLRKGFLTVPPARAVADTARLLTDPRVLRAVLTEAVRQGGVPVPELLRHLGRADDRARRILSDLSRPPRAPTLRRQAESPQLAELPRHAEPPRLAEPPRHGAPADGRMRTSGGEPHPTPSTLTLAACDETTLLHLPSG